MIRIVSETQTFNLSEVAASLSSILGKEEKEIVDAFSSLFVGTGLHEGSKSQDELVPSRSKQNQIGDGLKRVSGCSHIYNRGEKTGTRCGKVCNANGLCTSHQPRTKIEKAISSITVCDAVLKTGLRAGQTCGKPGILDGKCSVHKKVVQESSNTESVTASVVKRRPNNNLDFDFNADPIHFKENSEWWKSTRSTEIDGKVYKQHRTTRLLLTNENQVAGLMINGKPVWRAELDNCILDWCKKSGLV